MVTTIIGIDPGLSGAIACCHAGAWTIVDMPVLTLARNRKTKREIDLPRLTETLRDMAWASSDAHAVIEQVGAMPGQGVSSVFSFGKSYGCTLGILAALQIPVTPVAPVTWKKAMGVNAGKDGCRARAAQLLPGSATAFARVKDDGRAEAALIALYGLRSLGS